MADLFDTIGDWLLDRAIEDADLSQTLSQLGNRLIDAGVPLARLVVGRGLAHPVIGLATLVWKSDRTDVTVEVSPQDISHSEAALATPFGYMALRGMAKFDARLSDPELASRFPLFQQLKADGITHYIGLSRRFTPPDAELPTHGGELKGAVFGFCTKRLAGFSQAEIDGLERLIAPLCVCVRVAIDRVLVTELMARYLGRVTGARVLTGQTARGDGTQIDCALFYSDMRNSLGLSQHTAMEDYLQLLNGYFDCTAGAVLDHGGEILKFIGDGVLAIFPFDPQTRPPQAMCATALSAARDAFARLDQLNATRADAGSDPISFGIGLHAGTVIYGNVGTEKRLDFTATGPAVGLVSRCEAMTKSLGADIVATEAFVAHHGDGAQPAGSQPVRGFAEPVPLFSYERQAPR